MTSMASRGILEAERAKVTSYAMIVFIRCPGLEVSLANFILILHVYFVLEINPFGICDKTLVRAGTGLYWPA